MKIILGINVGRESGASLIIDNKIIAAVNEERLSRKKMAYGFPYLAINEVLAISNQKISDLNIIAIEGLRFSPTIDNGFDMHDSDFKKKWVGKLGLGKLLLSNSIGLRICQLLLSPSFALNKYLNSKYFKKNKFVGDIVYVDHHLCHANTAFMTQKRSEGIAITFDANGEGYCSKVYLCKNGNMKLVHKEYGFNSPAYYYAYITKILGFTPNKHEGKITGLAAFGNSSKTKIILENHIQYLSKTNRFVNRGGFHIEAIDQLKLSLNKFSKEDIAAGIQDFVEDSITSYINYLILQYCPLNRANLFLAGGLFANVKLNQRISELNSIESMYVFPNMGDGGLNLGAALQVANHENIEMSNLYLGKRNSDDYIKKILDKSELKYIHSNDIALDTARLLLNRKVVAFYAGRMEYGPRSLGNRSILFLADDKKTNTWLNERLGRTEFMPFAPVIRDVDASKYFLIDTDKDIDYRFMTVTVNVTSHCKLVAPAIVHVDGTARPQILTRNVHSVYYDILSNMDKLCGEGILVNTSFNMHEEPIINTPQEAIACFMKGGLDCLIIENYIIQNE